MTLNLKKISYRLGRLSVYIGAVIAGVVAETTGFAVPILILLASVIVGEYLCYVAGQKGYVYSRIEKGPEDSRILILLSAGMCGVGIFAFLKTRDLSLIPASGFCAFSAVYLIARRQGRKG